MTVFARSACSKCLLEAFAPWLQGVVGPKVSEVGGVFRPIANTQGMRRFRKEIEVGMYCRKRRVQATHEGEVLGCTLTTSEACIFSTTHQR